MEKLFKKQRQLFFAFIYLFFSFVFKMFKFAKIFLFLRKTSTSGHTESVKLGDNF